MNESEKLEELKDSIIRLDEKLNKLTEFNSNYTTSINTINNPDAYVTIGTNNLLDSYVTVSTIDKSFPNNITLDLDDIKNLIIIYKGREYLVDAETFISLLFNYEEIIREIIREELNL